MGGLSVLITLMNRWILYHFLPYYLSIIIAYISGMIVAFILFKIFVFKSKASGKTSKEIFYFILVNLIAVIQTLFFSLFFANFLFPKINFTYYPYDIAHFIGTCVPIISSFILHQRFTFKKDNSE
jgi:putative flippase GtrA